MTTIRDKQVAEVVGLHHPIVKSLEAADWRFVAHLCKDGLIVMMRMLTEPLLFIHRSGIIEAGYEDSPHRKTICKPKHDPLEKLSEHIKPIRQLWLEEQERRRLNHV